jgi:hypothetical protein
VNIRITLFLLCVLLTSGELHSQVLVGPVLGGQVSWVSFSQKENKTYFRMKPVIGYHAGLGLSFRVRKRFFLTSSFLYSVKGRQIEGKKDGLLDHRVTYKYIDIPIVYSVDFRAKLGNNMEFKYFVGVGPNISYWLGGKGTLYNSDFSENQIPELEYKIVFNKDENEVGENEMAVSQPNRVQLGLNLAAGMVVEPAPFQKFIFLLRYELGHSYFSKEKDGYFKDTYYQDDLQSRNQGVRASLIYMVDMRTGDRKKGKSTSRIRQKKKR